jgi:hypothetical protein
VHTISVQGAAIQESPLGLLVAKRAEKDQPREKIHQAYPKGWWWQEVSTRAKWNRIACTL